MTKAAAKEERVNIVFYFDDKKFPNLPLKCII